MEVNQGKGILYCSALRKGDILNNRYKVIRPPTQLQVETLDTETGKKGKQVVDLNKTSPYHTLPQESWYYRIVEINEDEENGGKVTSASVTLLEEDSEKGGTWRSFHLLDEEDIHSIKDGLQKKDQQVFCTIVKIMDKEVLGNVTCLPKNPPILRLPDEILGKIWDLLDNQEDILSLRLVRKIFSNKFLPIQNLLHISELELGLSDITVHLESQMPMAEGSSTLKLPREIPNTCGGRGEGEGYQHVPQAKTELLNTTNTLTIKHSLPRCYPQDWKAIADNSTKLESLKIIKNDSPTFPPNQYDSDDLNENKISEICRTIVSSNYETLQSVEIYDVEVKYNIDFAVFSACKQLKELYFTTIANKKLFIMENFESLVHCKDTLSVISLGGFETPLRKGQVLWIRDNFKKLKDLDIPVVHYCQPEDEDDENKDKEDEDEDENSDEDEDENSDEEENENNDEDEVDEHVMRSIMDGIGLPKLKDFGVDLVGCTCEKGTKIAGKIRRMLKGAWKRGYDDEHVSHMTFYKKKKKKNVSFNNNYGHL